METVSYNFVRQLWCDLCTLDANNLDQDDADQFNRLFGRVIRRGWNFRFWPDPNVMASETRHWRDTWTAQAYASGAEVYYAPLDSYWTSNASTLAGDVPGTSTKWTALAVIDAYIAYEQAGMTPFGQGGVKELRRANPRVTTPANKLRFVYDERGVTVKEGNVGTSPWILYRKRCPVWKGATWDQTKTYAAGLTRYYSSATEGFDGDFYTSLTSANVGESPETTPAKWSKIAIPAYLADFTAHGAKIGFLEGDGQLDKALANEGPLWNWLYDEIDQMEAGMAEPRTARVANI